MAMHLTDEGLRNRQEWEKHGVRLPEYDRAVMRQKTLEAPVWVHFGAGNIFRGFIAGLQQRLLDAGLAATAFTGDKAAQVRPKGTSAK